MRFVNPSLTVNLAPLAVTALMVAGCNHRQTELAPPQAETAVPIPLTNMVPIRAGSFVRGKQRVTLTQDYWIGRFEVTQAEYTQLMGANPSHFTGDPRRPVDKVSQTDAAKYCGLLTTREQGAGRLPAEYVYRLPTEAEWEYACRAGSTNLFSFGDDEQVADRYAWTAENSDSQTHPVGHKLPNPWDLHDMHGNVWEWCQDWFAEFPTNALTNPLGPASGEFKVFRGGGWDHQVKFARCGNRFMMAPANAIYFVGFRVALVREPSPPSQ